MKATLEFTLPEDRDEYRTANQAGAMRSALDAFAEYLRGQVKYVEPHERDSMETVRERFYTELSDAGVMLD